MLAPSWQKPRVTTAPVSSAEAEVGQEYWAVGARCHSDLGVGEMDVRWGTRWATHTLPPTLMLRMEGSEDAGPSEVFEQT